MLRAIQTGQPAMTGSTETPSGDTPEVGADAPSIAQPGHMNTPEMAWKQLGTVLDQVIENKNVSFQDKVQHAGDKYLMLKHILNYRGSKVVSCSQAISRLEKTVQELPRTDIAYRPVRDNLVQILSLHYPDFNISSERKRILGILQSYLTQEMLQSVGTSLTAESHDDTDAAVLSINTRLQVLTKLLDGRCFDAVSEHLLETASELLKQLNSTGQGDPESRALLGRELGRVQKQRETRTHLGTLALSEMQMS